MWPYIRRPWIGIWQSSKARGWYEKTPRVMDSAVFFRLASARGVWYNAIISNEKNLWMEGSIGSEGKGDCKTDAESWKKTDAEISHRRFVRYGDGTVLHADCGVDPEADRRAHRR